MRKARGYHLCQNTKDIVRIMKTSHHSSEAVKLRYIGITQNYIDKDVENSRNKLYCMAFFDTNRPVAQLIYCAY